MSFDVATERYTGKFHKRKYRNEDTGYGVCLYINGKDTTTVTGTDLPEVNYPVTFAGRWINHKDYGLQFEADIVVQQVPHNQADMVAFIASTRLGIGQTKARKMLKLVSNEDFWQTVLDDPDAFRSVVAPARVKKLGEKVKQLLFMENISKVCGSELKFDTVRYKRICTVFKGDLADLPERILENPFILIPAGFTFPELDSFANAHTCFPINDHRRLTGACLQVLLDMQARCHSACPREMLLEGMDKYLRKMGRVERNDLEDYLHWAVQENHFANAGEMYYLNRSMQEESTIINVLHDLAQIKPENISRPLFDDFIREYEAEKGFVLSEDQKNAVWTAMTRSICVITGGAGTGKSTILDALQACWKSFFPSDENMLLAPTGRAAVRMTECTGQPASTIHSALQLNVGSTGYDAMDEVNINIDVPLVVVDETSMVDQSVAASLLGSLRGRYSKSRQHLILVGDPDQLPSVGYGNVLGDIIASGVIPVCSLQTIYRQAADNPIVTNSIKMRDGKTDLMWTQTFRGYHNGDESANKKAVCKFYCACAKKYGAENVVLLSPYHSKTDISTDALNKELQEALNPDVGQPFIPFGKKKFRLGDRVMMLKNTEELNNGDIGVITKVVDVTTEEEVHLVVKFENGVEVEFPKENLFNLDLAYALSIHKSQGGQYRVVIMILPDTSSPFLQRNMVYTGITRSKEFVAVFGPKDVLDYAIRNDKYGLRYTGLVKRLQELFNKHQ